MAGFLNAITGSVGIKKVYAIGDTGPAGGKIYILPASLGGGGGSYYYEAWTTDIVNGETGNIRWSSDTTTLLGASGTAIGTGPTNTALIPGGASAECTGTTRGGESDWFFPSKNELNEMYVNRTAIGEFKTSGNYTTYWSSTEGSATQAHGQVFSDGSQYGNMSKTQIRNVRPSRRFLA